MSKFHEKYKFVCFPYHSILLQTCFAHLPRSIVVVPIQNIMFLRTWRTYGYRRKYWTLVYLFCVPWKKFGCSAFMVRSPLQRLVVSKAAVTSVVENLSLEFFDNSVMFQQLSSGFDNHFLIFYILGYLWFNNMRNMETEETKLVKIPSYITTRRIIRQTLFIMFFVFTKNVERAY